MAEANCNSGKEPKTLEIPPSCSAKRDIKVQTPLPKFKGKWKNGSWLKVPLKDIKPTPVNKLQDLSSDSDIPTKWSWMETGGNKIENGSRDQRKCGCCWAFSLATVLGDRYAIKHNIASPKPSVANLVSCGGPWVGDKAGFDIPAQAQCDCGGVTLYGSHWLENNSIRNENCWSFDDTIARDAIAPNCPEDWNSNCCVSCCGTDDSIPRFSAQKHSTNHLFTMGKNGPDIKTTIKMIQREIMGFGPVTTSISVPPDLQEWWAKRIDRPASGNLLSEDIYIPTAPPTNEGHAICLTGWGEKDGKRYWEVRNSWGSPGFAYFAMSTELSPNLYYGLDAPFIQDGGISGGVVTFYAGDLVGDPSLYKPGKGGYPVVIPPIKKNFFQQIQWKWIVIIGGILLTIIVLVAIFT